MKLLHLYHDLLNLYGEYGNVVVLKKHLIDQGFDVALDKKTINDDFDFNDYDFIYCGSGTEKNLMVALNDLLNRKESLIKAIDNDKVFLFTGNAMELLGKTIDGKEGLDIVPIETTFTDKRFTGDVIVKNETIGEVVGFINKCSLIKEDESIKLFNYVFKQSEINDNTYEGYHYKNVYGTHIIGPILVKNPSFMKTVIKLLGGDGFNYKEIAYPFEDDSYRVTLNALKERIK